MFVHRFGHDTLVQPRIQDPAAQWFCVSQYRTVSCFSGQLQEFPDQVPPELFNKVTADEWMLKVYPVLAECISRYQRPAKYTRAYMALFIMIVINICVLMVARVNPNKEDDNVAIRIFKGPGWFLFFCIPLGFIFYYAYQDGQVHNLVNRHLMEINMYFQPKGITFYNIKGGSRGFSNSFLNCAIHCRISSQQQVATGIPCAPPPSEMPPTYTVGP